MEFDSDKDSQVVSVEVVRVFSHSFEYRVRFDRSGAPRSLVLSYLAYVDVSKTIRKQRILHSERYSAANREDYSEIVESAKLQFDWLKHSDFQLYFFPFKQDYCQYMNTRGEAPVSIVQYHTSIGNGQPQIYHINIQPSSRGKGLFYYSTEQATKEGDSIDFILLYPDQHIVVSKQQFQLSRDMNACQTVLGKSDDHRMLQTTGRSEDLQVQFNTSIAPFESGFFYVKHSLNSVLALKQLELGQGHQGFDSMHQYFVEHRFKAA